MAYFLSRLIDIILMSIFISYSTNETTLMHYGCVFPPNDNVTYI